MGSSEAACGARPEGPGGQGGPSVGAYPSPGLLGDAGGPGSLLRIGIQDRVTCARRQRSLRDTCAPSSGPPRRRAPCRDRLGRDIAPLGVQAQVSALKAQSQETDSEPRGPALWPPSLSGAPLESEPLGVRLVSLGGHRGWASSDPSQVGSGGMEGQACFRREFLPGELHEGHSCDGMDGEEAGVTAVTSRKPGKLVPMAGGASRPAPRSRPTPAFASACSPLKPLRPCGEAWLIPAFSYTPSPFLQGDGQPCEAPTGPVRSPKASLPGVHACGSRSWAVGGQEGEPSGRASALDLGMAPRECSGMNGGGDRSPYHAGSTSVGQMGRAGSGRVTTGPDPGQENGLTSVHLPQAPRAPEFATPDSDPPREEGTSRLA